MKNTDLKNWLAASVSTAMLATMLSAGTAYAQDNSDDDAAQDEIITVGTRRTARSAAGTCPSRRRSRASRWGRAVFAP